MSGPEGTSAWDSLIDELIEANDLAEDLKALTEAVGRLIEQVIILDARLTAHDGGAA